MTIKLSVIVPVYNAEPYLTECLESLLSQTLKECEFIFVNDGSTDNSKMIIEQFQSADNRIILINQTNSGVSSARNTGMNRASGEYLGFIDADDYIENDMYETLYNCAAENNCDIVVSNFESELDGQKRINKYHFSVDVKLNQKFIHQEIMPFFLESDQLHTVVNKIFRRDIIMDHKIEFPEKVSLGEDGIFNMLYFNLASSMIYIDYTGYHYREVAGSATRNIRNKDYFSKAIEVFITEPPSIYENIISYEHIIRLKSIRLIRSTLSYIYVYLKPNKDVSFKTRYRYVQQMISHTSVRKALPIYRKAMKGSIGRYEKLILSLIKVRFMLGILCAVTYSRLRNT